MARGKGKLKMWDPEKMRNAIVVGRAGEMGYLRAAKTYGVPKGTLEKYVKNKGKTPEQLLGMTSGRKPVLPPELEKLLDRYCTEMKERYFGLTVADVKLLDRYCTEMKERYFGLTVADVKLLDRYCTEMKERYFGLTVADVKLLDRYCTEMKERYFGLTVADVKLLDRYCTEMKERYFGLTVADVKLLDRYCTEMKERYFGLTVADVKLLDRYCTEMKERYFGLTVVDVKLMPFELTIRNCLSHPFNPKKKSAGKKWLKLCMKRHLTLCLCTPQGVSAARVKSFNHDNVNAFFYICEKELGNIHYNAHRVYNVDETGLTVVQNELQKDFLITSAEREALISTVACMNAAGNYVTQLFDFPQENMKAELMYGAPPDSISARQVSGWIETDIFSKWFDHFVKFTKSTESVPVILTLDGHHAQT
ncbi:hypothetical protein PR048_018899 [Dryococelus australis]|uniref:HTH psq-type domain-containing protein n=1 Tax=Dryococelus australis TaxID=614101 RepID=A0ABQ9H232_9NEOP|nr:hypothetical protein PR048_018899 [Dryococelus australis]